MTKERNSTLMSLLGQSSLIWAEAREKVGFPEMILLDEIASEPATIRVLQERLSGSLVYMQGGCYQSEADCNGTSLASYVHAIYGLVLQKHARNVLMIGCGGGTLATMLESAGHNVTIVDINPASFLVARKYFKLPVTVACHVSDGKSFLRQPEAAICYVAIVVDAYEGHHFPAHLKSCKFFNLVRQRLSTSGSVFVNIHLFGDLDRHADRVADCMGDIWSDVRILDSDGVFDRNAIVMGGSVGHLGIPKVTIPPAIGAEALEREVLSMKFRPRRTNALG
jgi:SAM-dependent methyltransferase